MRIVELLVDMLDDNDDQFIGVDGIALVKNPAHEENWLTFSEDKKPIWERLTPEEMYELGLLLGEMGEPVGKLEEEGFEIVSVKKIGPDFKFHSHQFVGDISSSPNESSVEDYAGARVRYKYVGPQDSKNRDFCAAMMSASRVYRIEDIQRMTMEIANPDFGEYDIFTYRGSYNCRHDWVELVYKAVDPDKKYNENRILVSDKRGRNLEGTQYVINPPTETNQTASARARRNRMSKVGELDGSPIYDSRDEAVEVSKQQGCNGKVHEHIVDGESRWMPCDHPEKVEMESYTDYPQYMSDAAQVALNYIEESGNPNGCMTQTGKVRGQQLAQRKPISLETMKRMKNYITRHRKDLDSSTSYDDGCGKLSMAMWGCRTKEECRSAEKWLETRINREEMNIDVSALEPYVDQTGTTVVEETEFLRENSKQFSFNYNDEKMEITGAAMIPEKLIIRRDMMGREFYVYFSKDTIRTLSQKFMRDKLSDSVNIEHTTEKAEGTYVTESWLVSDENNDKSKALGLDYPEGSWVVTMKTDSPKVWKEIKNGDYAGFSVEGYFTEKIVMSKDDLLMEGIKQILNETNYDK